MDVIWPGTLPTSDVECEGGPVRRIGGKLPPLCLGDDLLAWVDGLAHAAGQSRAQVVRTIIADYRQRAERRGAKVDGSPGAPVTRSGAQT
jgi:hypothetical protein